LRRAQCDFPAEDICHHQAPRTLCVNSDHSAVRVTLAIRTWQMFLFPIRYVMLLVVCTYYEI